ncbi:MAG: type II secretion system protein GspM [Croceibacterium sp.]
MIVPRDQLERLEPYWRRSTAWWSERSLREQVLLGSLAVVGIFALLLVAVIAPLRSIREDARAEIRNAALLEARIQTAGPELTLRGTVRRGTASAILTDSAAAAGVSIQRIEPDGADTRVVLGDAAFDQVMKWIANVEQSSRLRVVQAQIERKAAPGIVSATIVVTG